MSKHPFMTGVLISVSKNASEDVVRWVEYARKHPKDATYAMEQLLLVADTLKRAESHAEAIADRLVAQFNERTRSAA